MTIIGDPADLELELVGRTTGTELAEARPLPLFPNPFAQAYITQLSPRGRPAQQSALDAVARILTAGAATRDNLPWQLLTAAHVRSLKAALLDDYAPRTVNRTLAAVKGVLRAAWEADAMPHERYMKAINVKGESTQNLLPAGRWVPRPEVEALLKAARAEHDQKGDVGHRDMALIVVLYGAGLRRQEACSLDTLNYDDTNGQVTVERGKRGKYRTTYLVEGLRDWIRPWWKHQRELGCEALFTRGRRGGVGRTRMTESGVDLVLERLCKAAGIRDVTPHDLRRSFASELLDAGADILMVQELMGHANVSTTKIYDKRAERGKQAAISRFPTIKYDG